MNEQGRNRLAGSTSPYLLQHAGNPVDWYPWGQEALQRARREDRPILLSIGYSACHWCHVMARESFEDPDTAALMNRLFVNIKVDREERPDLDRIYQTAHQLLARRPGGWPLTVFLTPDQRPFFAGTYFPPKPRGGLPAFRDLLEQVAGAYREQRDAIEGQNQALVAALEQLDSRAAGTRLPGREPAQAARAALEDLHDRQHGGFGEAPKFPQPTLIERLLRDYARSATGRQPDRAALQMACNSLRRMALGGLWDHVGGGFFRYSVDRYWSIPHFEKMLYDNAQLLGLYAEAFEATGDVLFQRVARETADFLLRDLRHPAGGFCAALGADSDGGEGTYYLWTPEQVQAVLDVDEARLVMARLGLEEPANFQGRWHLHADATFSELAARLRLPRDRVTALWESAREKLRRVREQRSPPLRDDKLLTAWNALAASGLARAARVLEDDALGLAAQQTLRFLQRELCGDARLRASWREGVAAHPATLDDHAALLVALLEMLALEWDDTALDWAVELGELLLARFQDPARGGFYFTADDHEPLIHRPRPFADESTPSGNALAVRGLLALGELLGEARYLEAAEGALKAAAPLLEEQPLGHCALVTDLERWRAPEARVLLRLPEDQAQPWRVAARRGFAPERRIYRLPPDGGRLGPGPAVQVCAGQRCLPEPADPETLARQLSGADEATLYSSSP